MAQGTLAGGSALDRRLAVHHVQAIAGGFAAGYLQRQGRPWAQPYALLAAAQGVAVDEGLGAAWPHHEPQAGAQPHGVGGWTRLQAAELCGGDGKVRHESGLRNVFGGLS